MNGAIAGRMAGMDGGGIVATLLSHARVPPEVWSVRRRFAVASVIAVAVFVAGDNAWLAADLGGVQASRTRLEEARRHLADARQAVARLPALRGAAAKAPALRDATKWTTADDLHAVSQLAGNHGVELLTLAPQPASGTGTTAMRPLRLTARADFAEWLGFLRGLPSLPTLVVPADVTIRRQGGMLTINATLDSFSALHPAPTQVAGTSSRDEDEDILFFDPFSPVNPPILSDDASLRLVGLLRDSSRGLALVETPDGVAAVTVGERLGAERVVRIDPLGISLTGNDRTHTLMLAEVAS
ncbi:hypothetical protein [Paraburkholderia sp. GAS334]|uniref:hypothetical protein n=1 Tax=Paraburkholderia sp. GAS334 TaxID=3035131 RepID=UPI003D2506EA